MVATVKSAAAACMAHPNSWQAIQSCHRPAIFLPKAFISLTTMAHNFFVFFVFLLNWVFAQYRNLQNILFCMCVHFFKTNAQKKNLELW